MSITIENQRLNHLQLKDRRLDFKNKTLIMGILNITPDSFSDGGSYNRVEEAVQRTLDMVAWGADIIDIGGESTRPGHVPVPVNIEVERVLPVIEAIRKVSNVPLSIDTYKAETARQAIESGVDIINDIWGAKADPNMARVAAEFQVPIILMHNRPNMEYAHLIEDLKSDLQESIDLVKAEGVEDHNIIIDPGIGFAKNHVHNLDVMNHLDELHSLGYPLLLATSRKRFIGETLDLEVHERMEGTGATVCLGVTKGCQIVRVHDVKPIARMVKMMDTMVKR